MLNDLNVYHEQGRKAGQAMKRDDSGLYRSLSQWRSDAVALERTAEDKDAATAAWRAGYREGYFK